MPDYWNRQKERWMDIFSDDEPDLMGLELVKEFDNLTKYFYTIFEEGMNEWTESSEIYVGIRMEVMTEETIVEIQDPTVRPTKFKTTRAESIPSTADETLASKTGVKKDSSEDTIVSDKNIKIVFQLPINNKKENIKVVAMDDYSVRISYMNKEGKRRSRTLNIPDDIDFKTAKATYKNGILEVKFDRQ
jgi:HSP20 family molecular chaperone IbpA